MIRGDPPDGRPGTVGDGAGPATVDAALCPEAAPAATPWHPATATATTANAAARLRPCCAAPSQRDPGRLIQTSSSTMAIANAPPPQGLPITTSRGRECVRGQRLAASAAGRSAFQQGGELLGVGLGVVAVAVVEQDVGVLGIAGQGGDLGCPVG